MRKFDEKLLSYKPLCNGDFVSFFGVQPPYSLRGYSVYYDNVLYGAIGYYNRGRGSTLFTDFKNYDDFSVRFRLEAALTMMEKIKDFPKPIYTYTKSSDKLLTILGFAYDSVYKNELLGFILE
jgi:hypothetical protein